MSEWISVRIKERTFQYTLWRRIVSKIAKGTKLNTASTRLKGPIVIRTFIYTLVRCFICKCTELAKSRACFRNFIQVSIPVWTVRLTFSCSVIGIITARAFCYASICCIVSEWTQWNRAHHQTLIVSFLREHWWWNGATWHTRTFLLISVSSLGTCLSTWIERYRTIVSVWTVWDTFESCWILIVTCRTCAHTRACSVIGVFTLDGAVCNALAA